MNENKEYKDLMSKENWVDGPWKHEPDYEVFDYKGFTCRITRNTLGSLCGYVALPKQHTFFGMDYDDIPVDAYQGLTYGQLEDDGLYWIGFDCAHLYDVSPKTLSLEKNLEKMPVSNEFKKAFKVLIEDRILYEKTYKDIQFVRKECKKIVDQLCDLHVKL